MRISCFFFSAAMLFGCQPAVEPAKVTTPPADTAPFLVVLGTVQDAGSPQVGCRKACCLPLWEKPDPDRMVVSLGLVDPKSEQTWLLEATPDMPRQLELLRAAAPFPAKATPDGIFLTHAHIGHYTGLMYLGREALGGEAVPVYAMPRMRAFLEGNGPWDQLIRLENIELRSLSADSAIHLSENLRISPFRVPHRDEYSETVGFRIRGPNRTALFIPDIDKWEKWERSIVDEVKAVDHAFLDATFFSEAELPGRNMSEIPHPFVPESMLLFQELPPKEREKVCFIHFNHTNPLLDPHSAASKEVARKGFSVARPMGRIGL